MSQYRLAPLRSTHYVQLIYLRVSLMRKVQRSPQEETPTGKQTATHQRGLIDDNDDDGDDENNNNY